MQIFRNPREMQAAIQTMHREGQKVALVPTMGFIHQGHIEVVRVARQNADRVVVSIFVNPTQFNDPTDYEKYPRDEERDARLLREAGTDILYLPRTEDIYPEGVNQTSTVLLNPSLTRHLCGATRAGHFEGVLLVVSKLMNKIQPDVVVFGEKDYQQYIILKRLTRELLYPIDVLACPIIREESGLAMSSRNARLSDKGIESGLLLYRALQIFRQEFDKGNPGSPADQEDPEEGRDRLQKWLSEMEEVVAEVILTSPDNKIDYVQILDAETLNPVHPGTRQIICGLAVHVEQVRLIDNMVLNL